MKICLPRPVLQNVALLCLLLPAVSVLRATDGHQLIGIGAIQKSTGGAGVARGADATWVLLNPAAIHGLPRQFDLSFEVFAPTRTMKPQGPALPMLGGNPLANSAGTAEDDSVFYIPSIGLLLPLENATFGLGFYSVNGMGVDYAFPRTTIPLARGETFDTMTEYGVGKLAAAIAWEPADTWVLGLQASLDVARFKSDMMTQIFGPPEHANDWDTRLGAGFQLGFVKELSWGSLGGTYISRQWMDAFEDYEDLFQESLDLPPMLQLGAAWDLNDSWLILLDGKWIGWSTIDQIGKSPDEGGFGWRDQYILKTGVVWDGQGNWKLRAGFSHGESPIREDNVFANALFPAITETHLTFGAQYRFSETLDLHATLMHAFENRLTQSASGSMASAAGAGTEISLEEQSLTLQITKRF